MTVNNGHKKPCSTTMFRRTGQSGLDMRLIDGAKYR